MAQLMLLVTVFVSLLTVQICAVPHVPRVKASARAIVDEVLAEVPLIDGYENYISLRIPQSIT